MSSRLVQSVAAVAALAAAGCAAQPALPPAPADLVAAIGRSGPNECNPELASVLAHHGVTAAMINSVRYMPNFTVNRHGGEMNGQTAWVYLNGQPGAGLVTLSTGCRLESIAADGGLKYPRS